MFGFCFTPFRPQWTCLPLVLAVAFWIPLGAKAKAKAGSASHGAVIATNPSFPLLAGRLKAVGSDTMANLMARWVEQFAFTHPAVVVESEGKGSGAAPAALAQGAAQLAPMSRPMKREELENFQSRFGYLPTEIEVGLDVLVIYVHKSNPMEFITLEELDGLFSKSKRRGLKKTIKNWGDLGIPNPLASKPIQLYGRSSASGTYSLFRELVNLGGDFQAGIKEQAGSAAVVDAVGGDPKGIGYSGIGYNAQHLVRQLSIKTGNRAISPNGETAMNGDYPLSRPLVIYVNKHPHQEWDPLVKAFIAYVLSPEGQKALVQEGYIGLPPHRLQKQISLFL